MEQAETVLFALPGEFYSKFLRCRRETGENYLRLQVLIPDAHTTTGQAVVPG